MLKSIKVPQAFQDLFIKAESFVDSYFKKLSLTPKDGTIEIDGERYILLRASSMSVNFLGFIKDMYPGLEEKSAITASSKVLFDMAKSFGTSDAKSFHSKSNVTDPIDKLSTGPVHFAYTGWANVEIHEESVPTPNEEYFLLYDHPNTFEADSWLKKEGKTDFCTCFMSAGYSSGWCQQSFGIELRAQEITCRAKGDQHCRFIMAQPHKLDEFVSRYKKDNPNFFRDADE